MADQNQNSKDSENLYQIADEFINLANELANKHKDVGIVGTAMRFAAARYNAFEASVKSADLGQEKQNALDWFCKEYKDMLNANLDDHIANPVVKDE